MNAPIANVSNLVKTIMAAHMKINVLTENVSGKIFAKTADNVGKSMETVTDVGIRNATTGQLYVP